MTTTISALNKLLLAIVGTIVLTGCKMQSNFQTRANANAYLKSNKQVFVSRSTLEEYVSRIGKRLIIVSDNPHNDYRFMVTDNSKQQIIIKDDNQITLTRGLLASLPDEAALAAVLSKAIVISEYDLNNPEHPMQGINYQLLDVKSMQYTARAGYDPNAIVELQANYLQQSLPNRSNWLHSLFMQSNWEAHQKNKQALKQFPKGLLRGKDRYIQILKKS